MKFPKQFKVFGEAWSYDRKWNLRCPDTNDKLDGWCNPNTRTIYTDRSLTGLSLLKTFIHETMHAAIAEARHSKKIKHLRDDTEEQVVLVLEEALADIFVIKPKK